MIATCRVTALLTNQKVQYVTVDDAFRKSEEYKKLTTTDKFPLLQTSEGGLHETTAICKYFCALADNKFLGSNAVQRSQVDQWISFNNSTLAGSLYKVYTGIFGWGDITQADWNEAMAKLKKDVRVLHTALEGKKWLLGDEMSIADIVLANSLLYAFQTVLDAGFRKSCKNLDAWATACYAVPEMVKVHGNVHMAAKPLKPVCKAEEKKEAPKKQAAAPKPKEEPKKKEEKPKDNVAALPPTDFNLYDFKTFFINHPDQAGKGVDEMYKMLDWKGWAFWKFEYDIYEGEGAQEHITNNLMNGFLNRAESVNKICFARHCVLGEIPNLQIYGVWLCRGPEEVPDGLRKDHPQFEYYNARKMDPRNNKADDKLVRAYWGGKVGDVIDGKLKAVTMKWFK